MTSGRARGAAAAQKCVHDCLPVILLISFLQELSSELAGFKRECTLNTFLIISEYSLGTRRPVAIRHIPTSTTAVVNTYILETGTIVGDLD